MYNGEEILYQSIAYPNKFFKRLWLILSILFLFLGLKNIYDGYYLWDWDPLALFYLIIGICFVIGGFISVIFLRDMANLTMRSKYYLTNKRVIVIYGNTIFLHKRLRYKSFLHLRDITHIESNSYGLIFNARRSDGVMVYRGIEEKRVRIKEIGFFLCGEEGRRRKAEILNILSDLIGFKNHPNLSGLNLKVPKVLDKEEPKYGVDIFKLEKKSKEQYQEQLERNSKIIRYLFFCFIGCVISIIVLSIIYRVIPQEQVLLIEIIWLAVYFTAVILLNILCWYKISSALISRIKYNTTMHWSNSFFSIVCDGCGVIITPSIFKVQSQDKIKPIKLLGISGYFCRACYKKLHLISIKTIFLFLVIFYLFGFITIFAYTNALGYIFNYYILIVLFIAALILTAFHLVISYLYFLKIYYRNGTRKNPMMVEWN